jgi:hypothetical protein
MNIPTRFESSIGLSRFLQTLRLRLGFLQAKALWEESQGEEDTTKGKQGKWSNKVDWTLIHTKDGQIGENEIHYPEKDRPRSPLR